MVSIVSNEKGYELLQIGDMDYDFIELVDNLEEILEYFQKSTISTPDYKNFNQLIDMFWKKKNYEYALLSLNKALEKYPDDIDLEEKKGEILLEAGSLNKAIEVFTALKEKYPKRFQVFLGLGDSLLKKKRFAKAEEILLEAYHLKSWDPAHIITQFEIMEMLAKVYYGMGNYEKSREFLESILTVQPRSQKWHLYFKVLKKIDEEKVEEAHLTYSRIKKAKRYASRAARYESSQRYELALKNFKKAIEINPFEPHYYFSVAGILESLPEDEYEFQFEEATEFYEKACEIFPNNFFYAMAYVGNLTNTNNWEKAFQYAKGAAEKFPELMLPNLRFLSESLGLETEYLELLSKIALEDTKGELSEIKTELALILKDRGDDEAKDWFNKASEAYKNKIKLHPYNWRNYYDYGCCLMEIENFEQARENLVKALEYHLDFCEDIAEKLSIVLMKLHLYKDARLLLEALVVMHPNDYEYLGNMGLCFLGEKEYEKAFEAFNRSILIDPYIPQYIYGAGVCAAQLDMEEDVVNIIKDLLEMDINFLDVIKEEDVFKKYFEKDNFKNLIKQAQKRREEEVNP